MKIPCPYCGADITYEVYSKNLFCTTCTGVSSIKDINLASFYKNDNCLNTYLCEMCGMEQTVIFQGFKDPARDQRQRYI